MPRGRQRLFFEKLRERPVRTAEFGPFVERKLVAQVLLRSLEMGAQVSVILVTKGENLGGSRTRKQALAMGAKRKEELLVFLAQIGVARGRIFCMGIPNTRAYMLDALRTDFYEAEVDVAVATLSSMLEPVIMLFLGVVVGGLVIAMYLPIFKMASAF